MSELSRIRTKRAMRRIGLSFGVSTLGSAAFAWAYAVGGQPQVEGVGLAVAFAGIAYGLSTWAKHLLPGGGYVEEHQGFSSSEHDEDLLVDAIRPQDIPLSRLGLLGMLGAALGAIGLATLFPLRSLLAPGVRHPVHALSRTPWRGGGLRLVDPDGHPIRPDDVSAETILVAYPQGHTGSGDAPVLLVRLDPARLTRRPPGGIVDGVVAYSLLCTHAGCAVALYEQGTGHLLCPCHQSAFDLLAGAEPIAGPAGRPLPGLPIAVDTDGYLIARGDFTAPPGPGYWSLP
jgi:ubiquinol-cytochrome c reductase iron-sulfur subunit